MLVATLRPGIAVESPKWIDLRVAGLGTKSAARAACRGTRQTAKGDAPSTSSGRRPHLDQPTLSFGTQERFG